MVLCGNGTAGDKATALCVCATNHAHHERTILVAKDDHDDPSVDIVVEPQSQPESLQSPGQVQ